MDQISKAASHLAFNLRYLRKKKNLSQQQLAQSADLPRTTLTHMESGQGNPSLTNLVKVAAALGVGIEELLSRRRSDSVLILAKDVPVTLRSKGRVKVYSLLPDPLKGLAIDRMEFAPLSMLGGQPHLPGTKEYMTTLQGQLEVYLSGERFEVNLGDVLAFPGNQPHSYHNTANTPAIAISVVIPVPATV